MTLPNTAPSAPNNDITNERDDGLVRWVNKLGHGLLEVERNGRLSPAIIP
ncbi:hypothetical protein [Aminobacter carboxidus]|uniref:Uncharacterized protein n=1 Tax=Aminobacter carboxidus TaxID=376165 RepID=A0ABR9GXF5_9HYPH|nr:hypothetical protein [Aminobacter carboxidus]MBE1208364.1 hypothetical protein [Aminobacter carboxidus]